MVELLNPLLTFSCIMGHICCLAGAAPDILVVEISMVNAV